MPFKDPEVRRRHQREYTQKWHDKDPDHAKELGRKSKRRQYSANPKKFKQRQKERYKAHKQAIYDRIIQRRVVILSWFREHCKKEDIKCVECGLRNPICLDFHHIDPKRKDGRIISAIRQKGWSKKRVLEEISKCKILCANCHRNLHNNIPPARACRRKIWDYKAKHRCPCGSLDHLV